MKRMILPLLLALSACTPPVPISAIAPAQIASHTTADDIAIRSAEQAYKLSRTIIELGVDSGLLKGANATKAANIDNQAYAALTAARTAYAAFNSPGLLSAASQLSIFADQVQALVKGTVK
ncbi:hypothetical protein D3Y57_19305 [Sphingomonas paeninsulae]|uniref:Lipoprotein n=1 Tax=Sphingomonas paeninsulae TaxID=2319844 RepID=A0A494TP95_SPHPE|nr:hypothetical protein [Sphingomonas paeninsulae]AYJ87681.1 hypothetical protein D3Y57_19305 [Sphingomonas paeninsulae]